MTDEPSQSETGPPPADVEPGIEPVAPAIEPVAPAIEPPPVPSVETTRRLLGASFDLLTRTSDDMRRASFYIGIITLGTVGPLAVASWAIEVVSIHKTDRQMEAILLNGGSFWLGSLASLAGFGLLVAAVESRAMAAAILGGHLAGRPVSLRASLERSRTVFWGVIAGSIIVGVPLLIAQFAMNWAAQAAFGDQIDVSIVSSTVAAAVVGAPLAYILSGIVLGDVGPLEAVRRSFRVFRARKLAAALVAVFETIATVLVILGLGVGLDIALRVFGALGLGADSGPAGLALTTVSILAGVFALGTLVYTAYAIAVAPQIVMFIGLTRATFGLDRVRPGGDRDPSAMAPGRRRFRWLTRPLRLGFLAGLLGLIGLVATLAR